MTNENKGYKRINFFKGFLTTEKDWNDAEAYHIEKRRLQNRILHSPGVVLGQGGELRVLARSRGDLAVEIQPGYAIDGAGNELILWDAAIKNVDPSEYRLPQTIYFVLRFREEPTDYVAYKENMDYKGHRRLQEFAVVEVSQTEPDITREVELARVHLEKDVSRIRDARNPADPQGNELDLRFRPIAGVSGAFLAPVMRLRMEAVLWQLQRVSLELARRGVQSANNVYQTVNSALMLHASNSVDLRNVFQLAYFWVETQGEVCLEIDVSHAELAKKEPFADYKRNIEILRGLLAEERGSLEALTNLLAYQAKASESAEELVAGSGRPSRKKDDKKKKEKKEISLADWEPVKVMPNPEAKLALDGVNWVMVDQIDILDKESEKKHNFEIKEAKDNYRSRQKQKYPDGTVVESTGRAHVGGYVTYDIQNLKPGKPVVILRRMDYVYGDYEIEYMVNDTSAAFASCTGTDRINRWRNWPVLIPAEHVTSTTLTIKQMAVTAGRDVNMFHIWVYQPK